MLEDAISTMSASLSVADERPELDRFYTPSTLADELVDLVTVLPSSVADFAAGTGNLLAAAFKKWPQALLYGNDVDASAIKKAGDRLPLVDADTIDFLSPKFHARQLIDNGNWSVILLNPPFSQRETLFHVPLGQHSGLRCSRAMAFVMTAVQYLAAGGQLLVILPTSTLVNKIDSAAREVLRSKYLAEVVRPPAYGLFNDADVSTYILRITDCSKPSILAPTSFAEQDPWKITRGTISIARADRRATGGKGWVHTTGLNSESITHRYMFADQPYGHIAPFGSILMPRVGRFRPDKIVIVNDENGEFISDCIFAVLNPKITPSEVVMLLKQNFARLAGLYGGTGAPYISRDRLSAFLSSCIS